jgi:hypothetical protein
MLIAYLLVGFCFSLLITHLRSAPYVPSSAKGFVEIVKQLEQSGKFIDVGSGDGRIPFAAARLGYEAYGIESNLYLVLWSRLRNLWKSRKNKVTKFHWGDLHKHDYSQYDLVYLYLFPELVNRLAKEQKFKPGATIITLTFNIEAWKPIKQIGKYYIYKT